MDLQALRQLASDLATLEGPDRRLDLRLFALCPEGLSPESVAYLIEPGRLSAACIAAICDELGVPRYTGDADAVLPWEHVLSVERAPSGALWGAVQGGGLAAGEPRFHFGWGASEALARRAAALQTFAQAPEREAPSAREPAEPAETGDAPFHEAWKFEF